MSGDLQYNIMRAASLEGRTGSENKQGCSTARNESLTKAWTGGIEVSMFR